MITRLYVNNFRCLVAFEIKFDAFGVLCGPNGSGKSSVFDALDLIRRLATGKAQLGGESSGDIPTLNFTNWLSGRIQEFELDVCEQGHQFRYRLHIEQTTEFEKPRIIKESAECLNEELFVRDLDGVRFRRADGSEAQFPLDWTQAALASIQPSGRMRGIEILQQAIANLLIVRPSPRDFLASSRLEVAHPDQDLRNIVSWYRHLAQEQDWTDALREDLQSVWDDFKSFRLENAGINVKALQLRFENELYFEQLSDGEKMLIALYMIRSAMQTGAVKTVLIDEPDNYVGLPELQPWLLAIRELLDDEHQALIISHHPQILNTSGESDGIFFWRDNHHSPTRSAPLSTPAGVTPEEAIKRGWTNG